MLGPVCGVISKGVSLRREEEVRYTNLNVFTAILTGKEAYWILDTACMHFLDISR